ncbi:MAG: hypothetical protein IT281_07635, partial [Ignavibacteria bacterium]|nr:hypothetical protein [Ignavibacteria bacterium]
MIFIPIETSGEGDVNAHSRVQMALGEAKAKAKLEFKKCMDATGYTIDEVRAYVEANDYLQRPFYRIGHRKGIVGIAANFVMDVTELMKKDGIKPVALKTKEEVTA